MSALEKSKERRQFRRISDAIALTIRPVDEAANEQDYEGSDLPDYPTHVVSLSPNGLKCYHSESFAGLSFVSLSKEVREQLLAHIDRVARESFGGSVKLVNRS